MGYWRSVHGDRECLVSLVAVDAERKVKPELRNGFAFVFGFGEEESKWHPQKRGGSSLLRCEGRASGGDALPHKGIHSETLLCWVVCVSVCMRSVLRL